MNWNDDPEIQARLLERGVRMGILRSAIIWTPFFLAALGGFFYYLVDEITGGDSGSWFLIFVLAVLAGLFGTQSIQSILDLFAQPQEMEGDVSRRWARSDSFVIRSHYLRIGKTILRGDKAMLYDIEAGDRVLVRYFPRSAVLVMVDKLKAPVDEEPLPVATETDEA